MRIGLIIILLTLIVGCASEPVRKIASNHVITLGEVDHKKSIIDIFPAVAEGDGLWYHFYLQLKNAEGKFVDADPSDILLKNAKGKKIFYKLDRVLKGRYYLTLKKTAALSATEIDFYVQNKPLKERFKLSVRYPERKNSKITVVSNTQNKLVFQLRLADSENRPVELIDRPDVVLEGMGDLEFVRHVKEGIWEYSLIYPDDNQIMYFSVRAQGIYLERLHRYQHIEK